MAVLVYTVLRVALFLAVWLTIELLTPISGVWAIALAIVVFSHLGGCASDPRYKEGIARVQWQEVERHRLQAAGFPQYNHD